MTEVSKIQYTLKYDEKKKTATLVKKDGDKESSITVFADAREAGKKTLTSKEKSNSGIFDGLDKVKFSGSDKKFDSAVVATFLEEIGGKDIDEAMAVKGLKTDKGKMFDVTELEDGGSIKDVKNVKALYAAATKADPKREPAESSDRRGASDSSYYLPNSYKYKNAPKSMELLQALNMKANALKMLGSIVQMSQGVMPSGMPDLFGNALGGGVALGFASNNFLTAASMTPRNSGNAMVGMFEQMIGMNLDEAMGEVDSLYKAFNKQLKKEGRTIEDLQYPGVTLDRRGRIVDGLDKNHRIINVDDEDETEETSSNNERITVNTEETTSEATSTSGSNEAERTDNENDLQADTLDTFKGCLNENEKKKLGFDDIDKKLEKIYAADDNEANNAIKTQLTKAIKEVNKLKEDIDSEDSFSKKAQLKAKVAKQLDEIKNILKQNATASSTGNAAAATPQAEDNEISKDDFKTDKITERMEKIGFDNTTDESKVVLALIAKLKDPAKEKELIKILQKADKIEDSDDARNSSATDAKEKIAEQLKEFIKNNGHVLKTKDEKNSEEVNKANSKDIAESLCEEITDKVFDNDLFEEACKRINKDNILEVLDEYEKADKNKNEEDLWKAIQGEWMTTATKKEWYDYIVNALEGKAKDLGIKPEQDTDFVDFKNKYKKEFNKTFWSFEDTDEGKVREKFYTVLKKVKAAQAKRDGK